MPHSRPDARLARLAAAGLALVLVVLFASAAIRNGGEALSASGLFAVRAVHRIAASAEVLVVLALLWLAWRPGIPAAVLSVFLSILGILAGQSPPPAAAAGNLLGGLALAATFAWLAGRLAARPQRGIRLRAGLVLALLAVQCALGAWISIFAEEIWSLPLLAHGMLGAALAAGAAWIALRMEAPLQRFALLAVALAAPAAGFVSALFGQPLAAVLAHAAAAALLVAAAAWLHGQIA